MVHLLLIHNIQNYSQANRSVKCFNLCDKQTTEKVTK